MRMYLAYGDDGGKFSIGDAGLEAYGPDILKPPHLVKLPPQPEPEPPTEEELGEIAAKWAYPPRYPGNDYERLADEASVVVSALVTEVRRLRAELAEAERELQGWIEGG